MKNQAGKIDTEILGISIYFLLQLSILSSLVKNVALNNIEVENNKFYFLFFFIISANQVHVKRSEAK